jgi:(4S)-4-hydroxy-5-phosphonooxypentane-2,3-dione isomerase
MHIALVHVNVKPDCIEAFVAATNINAANSRQEPGIVRFDVLQQQDDPGRFVLVEVYRTAEAVAAHKATAHYATWRETVAPYMAEPRVGVACTNVSPSDSAW